MTKFDSSVFARCKNLKEITITESVNKICYGVFEDCKNLKAAYFYGDVLKELLHNIFNRGSSNFLIYFIEGKKGCVTPECKTPDGVIYRTATFKLEELE